jgi:hypothetical protein
MVLVRSLVCCRLFGRRTAATLFVLEVRGFATPSSTLYVQAPASLGGSKAQAGCGRGGGWCDSWECGEHARLPDVFGVIPVRRGYTYWSCLRGTRIVYGMCIRVPWARAHNDSDKIREVGQIPTVRARGLRTFSRRGGPAVPDSNETFWPFKETVCSFQYARLC